MKNPYSQSTYSQSTIPKVQKLLCYVLISRFNSFPYKIKMKDSIQPASSLNVEKHASHYYPQSSMHSAILIRLIKNRRNYKYILKLTISAKLPQIDSPWRNWSTKYTIKFYAIPDSFLVSIQINNNLKSSFYLSFLI